MLGSDLKPVWWQVMAMAIVFFFSASVSALWVFFPLWCHRGSFSHGTYIWLYLLLLLIFVWFQTISTVACVVIILSRKLICNSFVVVLCGYLCSLARDPETGHWKNCFVFWSLLCRWQCPLCICLESFRLLTASLWLRFFGFIFCLFWFFFFFFLHFVCLSCVFVCFVLHILVILVLYVAVEYDFTRLRQGK